MCILLIFISFYILLLSCELFGHFKVFLKMNMSCRLDKIRFTPCLHGCLAASI